MPEAKDRNGAYWIRGIGSLPSESITSRPENRSSTLERASRKIFVDVSAIGAGALLAYAAHPLTERLGVGRIIRQLAGYLSL